MVVFFIVVPAVCMVKVIEKQCIFGLFSEFQNLKAIMTN